MKTVKNEYEVGDIVFVSKYNYDNGNKGNNHLFVIINAEKNEVISVEYFGMIVSSHREKGNDVSNFAYNEPLDKNTTNGLRDDSIVKCDQIFSIPPKNIQFKIGQIDIDDYLRFMEAYNLFLSTIEDEINSRVS